jgi:hypothetical protein
MHSTSGVHGSPPRQLPEDLSICMLANARGTIVRPM